MEEEIKEIIAALEEKKIGVVNTDRGAVNSDLNRSNVVSMASLRQRREKEEIEKQICTLNSGLISDLIA
jgi:ABC-type lipopolysaccharide export system ATPase subunit